MGKVVILAILGCISLFSQGSSGRLDGTVTDQTGGAIVGAKVTVTDVQRGVARTLTTDNAGAYTAPNLIPGTYTVRAEFQGFRAVERTVSCWKSPSRFALIYRCSLASKTKR